MEKNKLLKGAAYLLIVVLVIVNSLGSWGLMLELAENQKQIIEQQKLLIEANIELGEILEEGFTRLLKTKGLSLEIGFPEIHVTMHHYRNGVLIGYSHHAGTLTTGGKNWIEDQLGDSPSTDPAKWIAHSNSTDSPSAAWTAIPAEITTGNMSRTNGTYVNDGDGKWNITKIFSPTETNSSRLVGLYWAASGAYLLASDTISVINYESGDTVTITWTITVT